MNLQWVPRAEINGLNIYFPWLVCILRVSIFMAKSTAVAGQKKKGRRKKKNMEDRDVAFSSIFNLQSSIMEEGLVDG